MDSFVEFVAALSVGVASASFAHLGVTLTPAHENCPKAHVEKAVQRTRPGQPAPAAQPDKAPGAVSVYVPVGAPKAA